MAAAFCIMAAVGMLRDRRVGAYVWCGFAGVALGGLFLFAAPGLYSRLGHDLGASEVLRKGGFCAYAESLSGSLYVPFSLVLTHMHDMVVVRKGKME